MAMKRWGAGVALAVFLLARLSASDQVDAGANKVGVIKYQSSSFGGSNHTGRPAPATPPPRPFSGKGGRNCTRRPSPTTSSSSRIVVVGGSDVRWNFGYNYTDWALRTGPFYKNDSLVFRYDPPSNGTFPHSVYLLKDRRSFVACDLRKARMVGGVAQGGGDGFSFVLRRSRPHYFACGERGGFHCRVGMMKFPVFPSHFKRCH